ncbi:uncharacterized protein involved in exopolysaccharide biosynthesis [Rhodoblastus acidophilus]|uniref:GumC family protein n=1 Tax=Rhodoblastus acidophilus TaxID=1074 RepID=UPI0022258CD7|nr:GNVR domain-containing protein [Rhodoblastus acidophilus]MCW2283840.1 uncharacterized protein involved in exopolysaccharide biosynthesis [Rhodoblastus acidophilus]MCW2332536.1 uncharacterized protein involved in exopolysaccharide biosynthesis [Rhodoblastus acidophilus]
MSLPLFLLVLRKRIALAALLFAGALLGAAATLALAPQRFEATAVASIDPSSADPVSGLGPTPGSLLIVQGNLAALAKSNQIALDVVDRLGLDGDPEIRAAYAGLWRKPDNIRQFAAERLLDRLDAKFLPGSNVLSLSMRDRSPENAARLANGVMAAFIEAAIALKGQTAQKAADWFAPQIEKVAIRLAEARARLETFQTEARLLAPGAGDAESDRLLQIGNALSLAKTELVALQSQLATPGGGPSDAQNPDVQTLIALRTAQATAEADIARLQADAGPNHPKMLERQAARDSLRGQIGQAVDAYRTKLGDRVAAQLVKVAELEKTYAAHVRDMVGVQGQRDRLAQLRAEAQFQQDEYDRLQRAAVQARLQSQLSFSNIAVIDVAAPPSSPIFPKPLPALALACVAGLGVAVLGALIAETLDRRIRRAQDISEAAGAPLLGVSLDFAPPRGLFGARK